jgi:hypothetical protein
MKHANESADKGISFSRRINFGSFRSERNFDVNNLTFGRRGKNGIILLKQLKCFIRVRYIKTPAFTGTDIGC